MSKNKDRTLRPRDDGVLLKYAANPGARKRRGLSDGAKVSAQTSCTAQIEWGLAVCKETGVINNRVASGLSLEALASEAVIDSVETKYGSYQEPQIHTDKYLV